MADFIRFGRFQLNSRTRTLYEDGVVVPLGPKVVETLDVLVRRRPELVTKSELMDAVWPERYVGEGTLTQNIYRLRKILAAGGLDRAIETLPGRGYRFCATVATEEPVASTVRKRSLVRAWLTVAMVCVIAVVPFKDQSTTKTLSGFSQHALRVALYHLNLRSDPAHARNGLATFKEIIDHDPQSAIGYAGAADAYLAILDDECDSTVTACPKIAQLALAYARRAVSVDSTSAQAHTALAMALNEVRSDDRGAAAEFQRAITLDPSYALAHHWYGNLLTVEGRYDTALREHRIAASLDPTSAATFIWLANDSFLSHDYRSAIAYARTAEALGPIRHPTLVLVGLSYERLGQLQEARRSFQRLGATESRALLAALIARRGDPALAVHLMKSIDLQTALEHGATEAAAFAWLALGDKQRADVYLRATPLPNRIEKSFLARDPRWTWNGG